MKGHTNLQEIYHQYELFVSASQSEGFGLTLMEAVGSGLGMIGFDVNYGSPTFIRHNENGYLIPIDLDYETIDEVINRMADKIVQFLKMVQNSHTRFHITSQNLSRHHIL